MTVTKKAVLFCVVYRTGGVENFGWHRSVADVKDATMKRLSEVRKAGYKAHMSNYDSSMAIGLPETYE